MTSGGRALIGLGGRKIYQTQTNSECRWVSTGVSRWEISPIGERETAQTAG